MMAMVATRARRGLLVAMSLLWMAAFGCSSFSSTPAETPAEAAAPAVDAAGETATGDDARPDAAAMSGFCASRDAAADLFCADFDEPDFETAWPPDLNDNDAGELAVDRTDPTHPSALRSTTRFVPGGGAAAALLSKPLLRDGAAAISLDFDMRVDAVAVGDSGSFYMRVASVVLAESPARQYVMLGQKDRTLVQAVYNPALNDKVEFMGLSTPKEGWFHLRMEIHFDTGKVATLINDTVAAVSTVGVKADDLAFTLGLGVFMLPSPDATQVFFDNVVVQKLP